MRLRNIPGAREHIAESEYVETNPAAQKGHWQERFGNTQPLHLEIGTGKGAFLLSLAELHPEINYIGIEKFSSVLLRALEKQEEKQLPNLCFLRFDAELIEEIFAPGEISRIYLNFSDPWPKDRHAKRRLPSKEYLRRYDTILTDQGTIEFKTDNRDLFDFAVTEVPEGGFQIDEITYDLHHDARMNEGNIMTEYEKRFSEKGNPICKYILSKRKAPKGAGGAGAAVAKTLALFVGACLLAELPFLPAKAAVVKEGTPILTSSGAEDYDAEAAQRKTLPIQSNEVESWPAGPAIGAEGAILIDADTGTILYNKNMHEPLYPASTTKLLTCLIAAEQLDMSEMVTFSHNAVFSVPRDGSSMGIDEGEKLTVEQCLYGIMVGSANEAANAIAEHISGSIDDFAVLMNERAKELGCENSHFVNANGLFDENHYTSAYDLAQIARAFFSNEMLSKIGNTPQYHFTQTATQPDDFYLNNKHELITGVIPCKGIQGGKTGYTDLARETLVTCCERDGMKLIAVVMKEENPDQFLDTAALFEYGYANFKKVQISDYETRYTMADGGFLDYGNDIFGNGKPVFSLSDGSSLDLPNNVSFSDLDTSMGYQSTKPYGTAVGEQTRTLAEVTYSYHGMPVGSANLLLTNRTDTTTTTAQDAILTEDLNAEAPATATSLPETILTTVQSFLQRFVRSLVSINQSGTIFINVPGMIFTLLGFAAILCFIFVLYAYLHSYNYTRATHHKKRTKHTRRRREGGLNFRRYDHLDD